MSVLLVALACGTMLQNTSGYPWNEFDRSELMYAKTRCQELYPDAPCVKLFRKWGKQDYSVVCGKKDK